MISPDKSFRFKVRNKPVALEYFYSHLWLRNKSQWHKTYVDPQLTKVSSVWVLNEISTPLKIR